MTDDPHDMLMQALSDMLREKFGPDVAVVHARMKPVAVREGLCGRTRWEIRLMPDDVPVHQILIEMPRRAHPRIGARGQAATERFKVIESHVCTQGPEAWWRALHLLVPQNEPCEEIALALAKVMEQSRVSWLHFRFLRFRRWLAGLILPEGYTIE